MIDAERYRRIDEMFQAALDLRPDERTSFISQACGGDESLREEVERLLASDESEWALINTSPFDIGAAILASDRPELAQGHSLGHYNIISLLGAGGMGQVYLAEDVRLGRKVAVKLLSAGYTRDQSQLRRFQQEARAASALNHPNILTIYDIWEFDGRHLIATEYIKGHTLRQLIKRSALSLKDVIDISAQTASALSAAHQAGIIHRDIKPENIMMRPDGLVKVLDFGLAKLTEQRSPAAKSDDKHNSISDDDTGLVIGTLPYMSPEQLRGEPLDARTDIFSLGAVIYEMLSGSKPFDSDIDRDLVASILADELPPLERLSPDVPPELRRIIERALKKNREERYQSADDLLIDLKRLKEEGFAGVINPAVPTARDLSSSISHLPSARRPLAHQIGKHKIIASTFLISAVALGLLYAIRQSPARSGALFERIKITNVPGTDSSTLATLSPDGRYLVYEISKPGYRSLWLREMDTNSDREITPGATSVDYLGASISPDGEYIYYARRDEPNPDGAIYRLPLMGGGPVLLLKNIAGSMTLSPEGRRLAFIRSTGRQETALIVANTDGSEERVLAARSHPEFFQPFGLSWSPDGKVIACTVRVAAGPYHMTLAAIEVESGAERPVGSRRWAAAYEAGWLADGKGILMMGTDRGQGVRQLWHISYPEGEVRRVTNDLNNYGGISLTADGGSLATIQYEMRTGIWIMDGIGSTPRPVANPDKHIYRFLSWTPDGRIVFPSNATENRNIWVMSLDGRAEKQLTDNSGENIHPSVSPDGRYIVFSSDHGESGSFNIWRMNIDGSDPIQLTYGSDDRQPRCSPDGRWIIYMSERDGERTIWRVPIEGGAAEQLTEDPSEWPDISPDGKLIACWYRKGETWKLAIIPFEGGLPVKTFDTLTGPPRAIRWTPDGSAITYVVTRNDISNLWSQPLNGGAAEQLTDFQSDLIYNFDWSREGRLICSRGYTARNVVLINDSP